MPNPTQTPGTGPEIAKPIVNKDKLSIGTKYLTNRKGAEQTKILTDSRSIY